MTDLALTTAPQSAPQAPEPSRKHRVTGKVRRAVEAMVWDGLPRKEAAQIAGISEHGLYKALRKPPTKAFYLAELDVLRTSARARNFHVLEQVRDQTTNQMARVNAVKALEQLSDDESAVRSRGSQAPGFTIVVVQQGERVMSHQAHIEAKPLSDKDDAGNDR